MSVFSQTPARRKAFLWNGRNVSTAVMLLAGFLSVPVWALAQNAEIPVKTLGNAVALPAESPIAPSPAKTTKAGSGEDSPKNPTQKSAPAEAGPAAEIPVAFPSARYVSLLEKSPFAIATAAPEPVAPVENFASNWFLSSFSKSRSKDGAEVYTVFVKSRDLSTRLMLVGEKPDEGVTLVAVEEAPNRADTVAVLRKGSDVGRVKFDQAAFAATPPPAAPRAGPVGAMPGSVNAAAAASRPVAPPASKTSIPRPGMSAAPRSGVSTSPSVVPLPAAVPPPAPPNGAPNSQDSRRRVRPIEASPAPQ